MFKRYSNHNFLLEEDDLGGGGAGEGSGEGTAGGSGEGGEGEGGQADSIYGDVKVQWPEGTDERLYNEPSIKPFVNEKGEIRVNSLLKSYYDTKKSFGADKITLPTDKSTEAEVNEFYNKLNGHDPVIENYKLATKDDTILPEAMTEKLREFGHTNKLPMGVTEGLRDIIEKEISDYDEIGAKETEELRETAITDLKSRWGEAYTPNVIGAKNLIKEYLGDNEALTKMFEDPTIGRNPVIIEMLGTIASKLYKEGKFAEGSTQGAVTKQGAQDEINAVMGNPKHAYHDKQHPEHQKAVRDMLALFGKK